jgi:hypothetical protein
MTRIAATLLVAAGLGVLSGGLYSLLRPPVFQVSAVVGAPVSRDPIQIAEMANGTNSLLNAVGSFSGLSPVMRVPPETLRYRSLLSSVDVAEDLIREFHPERHIFRDEWDAASKTWHPPATISGRAARFFRFLFGAEPSWAPPDAMRLVKYLDENVSFSQIENSRAIRVEFWSDDPRFGKILLTYLLDSAHRRMQVTARRQYGITAARLTNQLAATTNSDVRRALADQIARAETMRNLAATGQYGYEVVDSPSSTQQDASTNPLIMIVMFMLAGMYVGTLALLVRGPARETLEQWRRDVSA